MYYIAFFDGLKKNLIVPKQWLKDIKLHKEKFYNNSLNRSQKFVCFYTNNSDAFDDEGVPNGNFAPNFDLDFAENVNGDGLFHVKLKAYKGTREGAMEYINRHRNVKPAVYNKKRLRENPVPVLDGVEEDSDSSESDSNDEEIIIPDEINQMNGHGSVENSALPDFDNTTNQNMSLAHAIDGPSQGVSNENVGAMNVVTQNIGHSEPNVDGASSIRNSEEDVGTNNAVTPNTGPIDANDGCISSGGNLMHNELDNTVNQNVSFAHAIDGSIQASNENVGTMNVTPNNNPTETNDNCISSEETLMQIELDNTANQNISLVHAVDGSSQGISKEHVVAIKDVTPNIGPIDANDGCTTSAENLTLDNTVNQNVSFAHAIDGSIQGLNENVGTMNAVTSNIGHSELNGSGASSARNSEENIGTINGVMQNIGQCGMIDDNSSSNGDLSVSVSQNDSAPPNDRLSQNDINGATQGASCDAVADHIDSENETKPIVPMYGLHRVNNSDILQQLDDFTVVEVDGVEMTISSKGLPKPLNATKDGLIKMEKPDEISGFLPFLKTKTGRAYKIGERHMEIPHMVFEKFNNWKKTPFDNDKNIDKRFVFALLLALTEEENLKANNIPCEVMDFVQELLKIRCGEQDDRIQGLSDYANELCAEKRNNARNH